MWRLVMSCSLWRCRNRECSVPHGAPLGRLTSDGGLVLEPAVTIFRAYLDTRRALVACPSCGVEREFRGSAVLGGPHPNR
jgi:phage terminase large subunit GpA-like protein